MDRGGALSRVQGLIEAYAQENMGGMELLSGRESTAFPGWPSPPAGLSAMWRKNWPKAALSPNTWNGAWALAGITRPCALTPERDCHSGGAPSTGWTCTWAATAAAMCGSLITKPATNPSACRMCCWG